MIILFDGVWDGFISVISLLVEWCSIKLGDRLTSVLYVEEGEWKEEGENGINDGMLVNTLFVVSFGEWGILLISSSILLIFRL